MRKQVSNWAKEVARTPQYLVRRATSRYRRLPDFIIIGAQKSGTSSLFFYLSQHPDLLASAKKEVHYFDGGLKTNVDTFKKGEFWYRSHFPLKMSGSSDKKTFEASPRYIFNPLVPQRIHALIPDVKLVLVLRNPVDRAISHYFHSRRIGHEDLPIDKALDSEQNRISQAIKNKDYKDAAFNHFSYKSRGVYHIQIERFLEYFAKDQLLVLSSENFFRDPGSAIQRVCEFVGVESDTSINNFKPKNVGLNRENVDEDIYKKLDQYFEPYNNELYKLIGEDFGW